MPRPRLRLTPKLLPSVRLTKPRLKRLLRKSPSLLIVRVAYESVLSVAARSKRSKKLFSNSLKMRIRLLQRLFFKRLKTWRRRRRPWLSCGVRRIRVVRKLSWVSNSLVPPSSSIS